MDTRDASERMQIQEVFGLTGGELYDEPWTPTYITDTFGESRERTFTYWYEDPPAYAMEDFEDWSSVNYRTVCANEMFGQVPATVTDEQGTWSVVARFGSSGEVECPGLVNAGELAEHIPFPCPYCEGDEDSGHGYIYIGEGWSEIVYRLAPAHDAECTACEHDCPWHGRPLGAPYCQICDDHAEAAEIYGSDE
jgi:hypothetical protein